MSKKIVLLLWSLLVSISFAQDKLDKLVLAGPAANVSHPLLKIIESGVLDKYAKKVEFRLWENPDQLRAMIINKEVDFVAVPTNVGAVLYNKKQPIKMLNISIWGILKILVRDKHLDSIDKLKGSEVTMPWRGDVLDIVLQAIMQKKGITKKDIKVNYVPNPMDAAQQLIMRRADNIVLPEPAASMVLRKTKSFPVNVIAPTVYMGIDLQDEWGKAFGVESKIPLAGIAAIGDNIKNKELIKAVHNAYKQASKWYMAHPKEAGALVAKNIKMFTEEAVADSIKRIKMDVKSAAEAKKDTDFFFGILKQHNPKIIGGSVPDDGFYIKD